MLLIVEDDAGHRRLIEKNLLRSGAAAIIRSFHDGQAILDYLEYSRFGDPAPLTSALFLILDLRLPKLDGLEVLKRIKTNPELSSIPVSILSTSEDQREIDACYAHGCNFYFVKPFEYDRFCEVVSELGRLSQITSLPHLSNSPARPVPDARAGL